MAGPMREWLKLVVAVLLSVFAGLAALGGVIQAAGGDRSAHASRGGGVVLAVVFGLLLVVCVRWAARVEHRIRARRPGSVAHSFGAALPPPPPPGVRVRRRWRRHYSPAALTLVVLEFVGGFIGCLVGAVIVHGDYVQSQYVQAQGVSMPGTVLHVHHIRHTSRYSTWYTADVKVQLALPVHGEQVSVAHFPEDTGLRVGAPVRVLVDPHQPGYAEFPGYPATRQSAWVVLVVFAVVLGAADLFFGWEVWHLMRRRRRLLASPQPPGMPSPAVG